MVAKETRQIIKVKTVRFRYGLGGRDAVQRTGYSMKVGLEELCGIGCQQIKNCFSALRARVPKWKYFNLVLSKMEPKKGAQSHQNGAKMMPK